MQVHMGTDRIVFVGERKSIKIARIRGSLAFAAFNETREDHGIYTAWTSRKRGGRFSTRGYLTRGIEANKTEARLAKLYPEIVLTTKKLLGGLINVQDTAMPLNHDKESIKQAFEEHIGDQALAIGHILDDPLNFGQNKDGMPRILDAGSPVLGKMLDNEALNIATQQILNVLR